jgi:hypothetical protein
LLVVLQGCETWYLTLREEHRLWVFGNRVQGRIFGPKRDETTVGWRELYNEGLYKLYSSLNKIIMIKSRRIGRAGHVARITEFWWESQKKTDH